MNKKLITLAVATAMTAPLAAAADTTLYGRLHTELANVDGTGIRLSSDGDVISEVDDDDFWDVDTNTTRIGVKGSEDLGNGLKAIFQAEWAFSSDEGGSTHAHSLANRLAYAGLSGGWGTAAIGRQWTPYYGAVDKTDIFNSATTNAYYLGTFRTGDAIAYVSPNFGGFQAKVAAVISGPNDADDFADAWNMSAEYNNGGLSVGGGYHTAEGGDADDTDVWGLAASYNFGMFKVIGQYESADFGGDSNDWDEWAIAGEAYFGNHTIRALYAQLDYDVDDDDNWGLGWQYSFSKRTRVYAEYHQIVGVDRDTTDGSFAVGDVDRFALGLRHDF